MVRKGQIQGVSRGAVREPGLTQLAQRASAGA
jgi:hypothetical protein